VVPHFYSGLVREEGLAGGWLGITDTIRRVVTIPVRAAQRLVKPVVKKLPTPVRKILSTPGHALDRTVTATNKALAKVEDAVKGDSGGGGGGGGSRDEPVTEVVELPLDTPVEEPTPEAPPSDTALIVGAALTGLVLVGGVLWIMSRRNRR
jgi:hypothetical protein